MFLNRLVISLVFVNVLFFSAFSQTIEEQQKAYHAQGVEYLEKAELDSALLSFQQLKSVDVTSYKGFYFVGYTYLQKQEYTLALTQFDTAIQLNPNYSNAYVNRGVCHRFLQNGDKSTLDFNQAIKLDPENAEAYYNRGLAYLDKDEFEAAIADFDKSIDLDGTLTDCFIARGDAYFSLEENEKAKSDYLMAFHQNSTSDSLSEKLAWCYFLSAEHFFENHELDSTIANLNLAEQFDSSLVHIYALKARVFASTGDDEKVAQNMAKIKALDSTYNIDNLIDSDKKTHFFMSNWLYFLLLLILVIVAVVILIKLIRR